MTEKRLYLKAGEGRIVRRESDGEPWPEKGDWAELTLNVRRWLKDGDLVKETPPAAEPEPLAVAEPATPAEPQPQPQPPQTEEPVLKPGKPAKPAADERK